jgi:hypothetical protein
MSFLIINSIKAILKHDEKNVSDSDKTSMKPILKHEEEKSSETDKKSMKPILKYEDVVLHRSVHGLVSEYSLHLFLDFWFVHVLIFHELRLFQ